MGFARVSGFLGSFSFFPYSRRVSRLLMGTSGALGL